MRISLSSETVKTIEDVISKGNVAEVKIEHGIPAVISIKRKKVSPISLTTSSDKK